MTRTIWYAFYNGEYHGHGHPHESGPRITIPLIILAALGAVVGLTNFPGTFFGFKTPEKLALRIEHFVEPVGVYFPDEGLGFVHASFNPWLAVFSVAIGLSGIYLAYLYYWKGALKPLHGLSERNALARWGKTVLENKYYFDWLYTDVIVAFVKRPLAKATYWFNQKVLDAVVDGAGTTAVKAGQVIYDKIDQGVVDGAVNGTAVVATGTGGELAHTQTGKVQQYAGILFAAAAILAAIFVLVIT
jgi:NADH-quinone oxidoreductase subunit L